MSARCEKRRGNGGPCGGVLHLYTDHLGRLLSECPRCVRRKAGICQYCPRPVRGQVGKSERCTQCAIEHERVRVKLYQRARRGNLVPLSRAECARLGGLKGGPARAKALTPERRREIGRKGGLIGSKARLAKEARRQRERLAYLGRVA